MFDYQSIFQKSISTIKDECSYRIFTDILREAPSFPDALFYDDNGLEHLITLWCSNDYLGQGCNPKVLNAICKAIKKHGAGSGGTRNISGNSHFHVLLEREIAHFHNKESALLFTSGYVANEATLSTLAKLLPNCAIFSDENNHASMIAGIRKSGCRKYIFKHNDMAHLENLLQRYPINMPKIIAFESVYSMDGDFGNITKVVELAKRYNALTYLDEVHAVGMYGEKGGGIAQAIGLEKEIDIIQATLGKAIGSMGGYIAANAVLVDTLRSYSSGFIFTTSLPPAIVAGALESIRILKTSKGESLRQKLQERATTLKLLLKERNLPVMNSLSHIVPVIVGNPKLAKTVSDLLLQRFNIYIQPINHPTVPKGTERLRITPTPFHSNIKMELLANALDMVWTELNIRQKMKMQQLE